ncbi:hypothetical protein GPECTOR_4g879 [Gonium pectorale]|uniref:Uncharacterized protein n=1 Tax=Gonium pectorale TaxID=33097 RepID=A0A150GYQ0_GONPE|nr:hypothetical protein GPECTOR_4g879 [Gonium pectorale]|eukprot:KXZ54808.1 hypothetical protein GPECTOR_4g879 [Gonium pectorale]
MQKGVPALVSELAALSPQQLREAAQARPDVLLDSRFLFWLRDRECASGLAAAQREALARLGQELTMMREWREEQANRTLLPSLASSLAYSNLKRWREESGQREPTVVNGVDLEQLYRLGEQEERKLRDSMERGEGGGGIGPRRGVTRSSIEEFTKHNKAYADLAAGAMARVRSRLMGFDDDGPSAAEAVLRALLDGMGSAEERATYLPEAFTPPGMQVSTEAGTGKPTFVVTTPEQLTAAARSRLAAITPESGAGSPPSQTPPSAPSPPAGAPGAGASAAAGAAATRAPGAPGSSGVPRLPSGEDEAEAIAELLELIAEYDAAVYSRKTPLERMGHTGMRW